MSIPRIIAALAVLLFVPVLAGCEDAREYKLIQYPLLTLEESTWQFVRISWGDTFEDAIELRVERKRVGSEFQIVAKIPATEREYTDDTVLELNTYKYRLWGIFRDNGSARSSILTVDVPEQPPFVPLTVRSAEPGVVSPDGTKLARVMDGRVLITLLASGRSTLATRGELGSESDVAWMPDSLRILLVADTDGEAILYLYDPRTGSSRVLARGATDPAISTDGQNVCFVRDGTAVTLPIGALPTRR